MLPTRNVNGNAVYAPPSDYRTTPDRTDGRYYFEYRGDRIIFRSMPPAESLDAIPVILQRWHRLAKTLSDPAVELCIEEFAVVLHTFRQLQGAGVEFDPMLTALMAMLERQAFHADDTDPPEDDDPAGGNIDDFRQG